jgi:hypothetical protein
MCTHFFQPIASIYRSERRRRRSPFGCLGTKARGCRGHTSAAHIFPRFRSFLFDPQIWDIYYTEFQKKEDGITSALPTSASGTCVSSLNLPYSSLVPTYATSWKTNTPSHTMYRVHIWRMVTVCCARSTKVCSMSTTSWTHGRLRTLNVTRIDVRNEQIVDSRSFSCSLTTVLNLHTQSLFEPFIRQTCPLFKNHSLTS